MQKSVYNAVKVTGFSEGIIKRFAMEHEINYKKSFLTRNDIDDKTIDEIKIKYLTGDYDKIILSKEYKIGSKILNIILKNTVRPIKFKNDTFEQYKKLVRRLTTVVKNLFNIRAPAGLHVDHRYSIYDGYHNQVPAYLIASKENLEIIGSSENLKKGSSSSITKDEPYKLHGVRCYSSSP